MSYSFAWLLFILTVLSWSRPVHRPAEGISACIRLSFTLVLPERVQREVVDERIQTAVDTRQADENSYSLAAIVVMVRQEL